MTTQPATLESLIGLNIEDLVPKDAPLKLGTVKKVLTLSKWSLLTKTKVLAEFPARKLQEVLLSQDIEAMARIAFIMLKPESKAVFEGTTGYDTPFEAFLDSIITVKDQRALTHAVVATIGIGEPEIKRIQEHAEKLEGENPKMKAPKAQATSKKTGPKSSTP